MDRQQRSIIIFLVKSLKCGIGGMEVHQDAFINYFGKCIHNLLYIVSLELEGVGLYFSQHGRVKKIGHYRDVIEGLECHINNGEDLIFFSNDFWTLEILSKLRTIYHNGFFMIRSGGNDIEKMPWAQNTLTYEERKQKCIAALNSLDKIIVNSIYSKNRFLKHGVSEDKLKIIRGGVNQELCKKLISNKADLQLQLRKELDIMRPYIFSFACRFVPFKGIELALKAIGHSSCRDTCHIVFAGEGELEDELHNLCKEMQLEASFLGPVSNQEVLSIIAASHLFINTSIEQPKNFKGRCYIHTETMGRSMMEAISVHTPIICTNVGGTKELFSENDDIGIMTDCRRSSISKAIELLISKTFNFHVGIDYSWDYIFNQYIRLMQHDIIY